MKKCLKIVIILILICLLCSTNIVYGIDIVKDAQNWIEQGERESNRATIDRTKFNDFAGVLWELGIFVVVIGGAILGIKYMFASVEEKASIKESIRPYLLGAIIILGALTIWKFSVEIAESLI